VAKLKPFDFSLFKDGQLRELARQIALELERRRAEARSLGRRGAPLVEGRGPRYRNPQNSAETWTGRGGMPGWVRAALDRGISLEELDIADDRPRQREAGRGPRRERS
jgi:DNA-binding protein H-NS